MKSRFFQLFGSLLSLAGCTDVNAPIKTAAGNLSQSQVDEIVKKCAGPSGMATIRDGNILIEKGKDLSITGCVLTALQATGQTSLSAIGNERYESFPSSADH